MSDKKEILFVSHDANRAGAQIFLYNIMEYLQQNGYKVVLLIINDWGNFKDEFEEKFETYYYKKPPRTALDKIFSSNNSTLSIIKSRFDIDLIYANTIASVHIIEELKTVFGTPLVTHIHELSYSISQFGEGNALKNLFSFSDEIIACSQAVANNLYKSGPKEIIKVIHSFVNNEEVLEKHKTSDKKGILKKYGLDENATWVCACGNADWRKAPDIFVQIAAKVKNPDLKFAWIGIDPDSPLKYQLEYDVEKLGLKDKVVWIASTPEAVELINAMDLFLLCSREDPFPLVMLEAALCQKPVFTFKNTGGGDEFVEEDAGKRAEYLDVDTMAGLISNITNEEAKQLGERGQEKVLENYSFEKSVIKIENLINNLT